MLLHNGASDGNFTHNTVFKCFYTIFTSYTLNDIYRYFSNTLDVAQTRSMKRFYLDLLFQSLAFLRKLLMLLSFSHQHLQRCFYALCFLIFFTDSIHFLGSIDCRRFFHNLFFSSEVNRLPFLLPKFSLQIAVEEKSELTTSRFFLFGQIAVRFYARGLEVFTKKKRITSDRHAATKENLALSRKRGGGRRY